MMYSGKAGGNGQNIDTETNTTVAVIMPSLLSNGTPTACTGTHIAAGWYVGQALMCPSSPSYGTPAQR